MLQMMLLHILKNYPKIGTLLGLELELEAALHLLEKELNDAQKSMRRYQKVRWLSSCGAVTILCDSLKSVMTYFRDLANSKNAIASILFEKLKNFKFIYCLYFLIDIMHNLSILNRIF